MTVRNPDSVSENDVAGLDAHAAIDMGTNSFHLVVARAAEAGGFEVITTEKEMVRLGSGGGDMAQLAPAAIERGKAALTRMVEVARSHNADVTAVATSAVREAANRAELVDWAKDELDVEIEVISGNEEARLIHFGVIHAVPIADRRALIVDIGGGSTEFIVAEGTELVEARSLQLGAIRITERFFSHADPDEPPSEDAIAKARNYLKGELALVARDLGGHRPQMAIGSSGTISAVALMALSNGHVGLRQVNGMTFDAAKLGKRLKEVLSLSAKDRQGLRGLDEKRTDIIVGGILLLDEIFRAFDLESMTVSDYALREGVLFDRFPSGENHLANLRRSNAVRLARQLDPDPVHAETTARLSLQIFDRTEDLHGLGTLARELLDVAALVHNIGMVVSHTRHHRHSQYILKNSDSLTGFTIREIGIVAMVARFHRKSKPGDKHREFADLRAKDKELVRVLSGILRVAIGLDRRYTGEVTAVGVRESSSGKKLVIEPVVPSGADVGLEIFSANERADLLSEALDIEVVVRRRQSDIDA